MAHDEKFEAGLFRNGRRMFVGYASNFPGEKQFWIVANEFVRLQQPLIALIQSDQHNHTAGHCNCSTVRLFT